jgi:hypothetical protein
VGEERYGASLRVKLGIGLEFVVGLKAEFSYKARMFEYIVISTVLFHGQFSFLCGNLRKVELFEKYSTL